MGPRRPPPRCGLCAALGWGSQVELVTCLGFSVGGGSAQGPQVLHLKGIHSPCSLSRPGLPRTSLQPGAGCHFPGFLQECVLMRHISCCPRRGRWALRVKDTGGAAECLGKPRSCESGTGRTEPGSSANLSKLQQGKKPDWL